MRGLRTGTTLGVGERRANRIGLGLLAWVVGLVWIFPFAWTVFTSFKTEQDAAEQTLTHGLSLERYHEVSSSTEGTLSLATAFSNSLFVVLLSTAIVMLLAIPAAYALAIRAVPKWRDVLFFFISTKFLPVVASIFPIYVYAEKWNLIGTRTILVVLYTAMNLPLAVWMTRSFFMEVPKELIEAAEIDGTKLINQLRSVILPIAAPGIAATALRERLHDAAMGDRERLHARQFPGQTVGRVRARVPAGHTRRLAGAEAHDPRTLDGRNQVRRD
jgi:sorbitol/mannitol transport system permease protein